MQSLHQQDQEILAARQQRRLWVFILSGVGATLLLGYVLWLFLAQGYQINVNPEDARPSSKVQMVSGAGFVLSNKVYTFSSNTVVSVSAQKYLSQNVVINPESPAVIDVTLQPAPVRLSFDVVPAVEAQWLVNGKLVAKGASLQWEVSPGEIQVSASHPWFEAQHWKGKGEPAEQILQSFSLVAIQGEISITSKPVGAEVLLDGKRVGATPLEIKQSGGEYPVEIRKPGYQTITDNVEIKNQALNPGRNYLLVPEQGIMQFSLEPKYGLLSLNNAPVSGDQVSVDADVAHSVKYEKDGYKSFTERVILMPDEARDITIRLEPEYGTAELTSSQPALVEINGKSIGTTPLTVSLQTIEQDIHFVKTGYRTVVKNVTTNAKTTSKVFAEMLSEFDARRKEGRPLFIAGLGIEMKQFRPRAYVMGSPDNEPFRRRNEHRVPVDFNRQVWVSKHEITEAQFAAFKKSEGASESSTSNLPVTNISWAEAAAFCYWLSLQEGLEPFYLFENGRLVGLDVNARGYRLPTEAEWEWLAKIANRRAPTTYSWGSQERIPKDYGNYADESVKAAGKFTLEKYEDGHVQRAPVGSFKADRTGLFDLDGNVSEWVHDRYTLQPPDTSRTKINYLGMPRGEANVIKGANFESGRYRDLRVALRNDGTEGSPTVGFRIARYE